MKPGEICRLWALGLLVGIFLLLQSSAFCQPYPTSDPPLDTWSFSDTTNWTSDLGYYPRSYENIFDATNGPGDSLGVDSTNAAWLQYNVWEADGTTNLNIVSDGSLSFWFAPNWTSTADTNDSGTGPGVASRLVEVGEYTTNASVGWWSFFLDAGGNNFYFSAQDGKGDETNYLSAPVVFTNSVWHFIALTWSSTNTSLYVDGICLTNGPGISILPDTSVISNGFTIGSDLATGMLQMHGAMNSLATYNYVLSGSAVDTQAVLSEILYYSVIALSTNASYYPAFSDIYDVVSGPGYLQVTGTNTTTCVTNSNVWMTNTFITTGASNTFNLGFMVAGGDPYLPYDVFATGRLAQPLTNTTWTWMGQAYPCQTNVINGLTNPAVFLLLGTPLDSSGNGLTDAYMSLVLHLNPFDGIDYNGGIPVGWAVLQGLNATNPNLGGEDPDSDGLNNLMEYLYGTNPSVSEGFAIWVSQPSVVSGIP